MSNEFAVIMNNCLYAVKDWDTSIKYNSTNLLVNPQITQAILFKFLQQMSP
jgi:hypothetical protein